MHNCPNICAEKLRKMRLWRVAHSEFKRREVRKETDVKEEHMASIFTVEE
jgi:hypothetical protein